MGSCNPKPELLIPPQKEALELCCKRLKIHLQIKQSKLNQEIINGENELVRRMIVDKSRRSKVEQLLLAERVVNGLKYTAGEIFNIQFYAVSIGNSANFICENIKDSVKMQPWQHKLYSMLYVAEKIPITTLEDYKKCMRYIHNQILMDQYTDSQVKNNLTPHPTPEEMNVYILQMSQRNNMPLQKINEAGHQFSTNFKPKPWDRQFKQKSNQFRDSLPKQKIFAKNANQYQKNQGNSNWKPLQSVTNPFDKKTMIVNKSVNQNQSEGTSQNNQEKLDNDDVSPNITDLMKKIGSSKNQFK